MNIITDAGPVGCVVIIPTYVKPVVAANRDLGNQRDKVVGNPDWIFADQAAFVGTNRVKIAKNSDPPGWIARILIAKHVFDGELGSAVGIYSLQRMILGIGQELRDSIDRRGGGEDEFLHARLLHRAEKPM